MYKKKMIIMKLEKSSLVRKQTFDAYLMRIVKRIEKPASNGFNGHDGHGDHNQTRKGSVRIAQTIERGNLRGGGVGTKQRKLSTV